MAEDTVLGQASERAGVTNAAYAYVRDVAPNVTQLLFDADGAASAWAAEDGAVSSDVYGGLAWAVAEAGRMAAVDAVSDAVAATFGAVAVYVAAANGMAADAVTVEWPTDTDAAEDVGYVVPVAAYYAGGDYGYPDAWAIVDVYGDVAWADTLARALAADLAGQVDAI